MTRARRYRAGLAAESAAVWLLRLKGWRILARRMKTPLGEIDVIARRGAVTAFVEVKKRRARRQALSALRPGQRRRMIAAARWWLAAHPEALRGTCRFDLVAVNDWIWPVHLANVFGLEEKGG